MLTARAGCTLAPTALTQTHSHIHLRLQNRGPGDEEAPIPVCTRDTCPHLCPLSDLSQVQGAQYCLGVRRVTAKVGFPLPQAENEPSKGDGAQWEASLARRKAW